LRSIYIQTAVFHSIDFPVIRAIRGNSADLQGFIILNIYGISTKFEKTFKKFALITRNRENSAEFSEYQWTLEKISNSKSEPKS
jgi:hypothetical protein